MNILEKKITSLMDKTNTSYAIEIPIVTIAKNLDLLY